MNSGDVGKRVEIYTSKQRKSLRRLRMVVVSGGTAIALSSAPD